MISVLASAWIARANEDRPELRSRTNRFARCMHARLTFRCAASFVKLPRDVRQRGLRGGRACLRVLEPALERLHTCFELACERLRFDRRDSAVCADQSLLRTFTLAPVNLELVFEPLALRAHGPVFLLELRELAVHRGARDLELLESAQIGTPGRSHEVLRSGALFVSEQMRQCQVQFDRICEMVPSCTAGQLPPQPLLSRYLSSASCSR